MPTVVAFLITELSVGGAQSALLRLVGGLNRETFAPFVGCLFYGDGVTGQAIRVMDVPVFDARMRHKLDWMALWRVYRWLRKVQPTILHTSLFHANLIGRVVGRMARVPILICSERTMAMEPSWRYLLNRLTIHTVDRVVAVSENVRHFFVSRVGLPKEKIEVIYNGVEITTTTQRSREQARQELGLPLDALVIGAVLRLEPAKGVDDLLRAFAHLREEQTAWLTIIGDGRERRALRALAEQLGISSRVVWAGYRYHAMDLLPAFDLFVQPSRYEGMPNAVLEAMACALPVVATAVGGTPEIIVDGENGLLVPPNHPETLAKAIMGLLSNPELRQSMGQKGKRRVECFFSVGEMIRQTEQLYEKLLQDKGLMREQGI